MIYIFIYIYAYIHGYIYASFSSIGKTCEEVNDVLQALVANVRSVTDENEPFSYRWQNSMVRKHDAKISRELGESRENDQ
jgi:hypothetical protein